MASAKLTAAEMRLAQKVVQRRDKVLISMQYGGQRAYYRLGDYDQDEIDYHSLPFSLGDYDSLKLSQLIEGLVAVEAEIGSDASVEIEAWDEYGDPRRSLKITGTRELEPEEEKLWESICAKREVAEAETAEKRKAALAKARAAKAAKELKEYERLKKKFG